MDEHPPIPIVECPMCEAPFEVRVVDVTALVQSYEAAMRKQTHQFLGAGLVCGWMSFAGGVVLGWLLF